VIPAPTFVAETAVTAAAVYAAVKADVRTPVSDASDVSAALPSPITGGPEVSNPRRDDPRSGNPVVAVVIGVSPIAGSPDVAISRADRLHVNGKGWGSKTDKNTEPETGGSGGGSGRNRQQNECEHQQMNEVFVSHDVPPAYIRQRGCQTHRAGRCDGNHEQDLIDMGKTVKWAMICRDGENGCKSPPLLIFNQSEFRSI